MRLLICTQVVDRNHPVLGFFHAWIGAFAPHFESVLVICLEEGVHDLPKNVRVHSLGKERGKHTRLIYAARFLQIMRKEKGNYDCVFVHMNVEYLFLKGIAWKMSRIPAVLWYNHDVGGAKLSFASRLVKYVLHTSPYAASAKFPHSKKMPAGIDTSVFYPKDVACKSHSLYFQGRVSKSKRVDVLLRAVHILREKFPKITLDIVGPGNPAYIAELEREFAALFDSGTARLGGPIPNHQTPNEYRLHMVSVNLTAAGNFDKSVLESIACGTPCIVSSPAFEEILPKEAYFKEGDAVSLAKTISETLSYNEETRREFVLPSMNIVKKKHSLSALSRAVSKLF